MNEQEDIYTQQTLIQKIEQFNWSDVQNCDLGLTPQNASFQFQPPKKYANYYKLFRTMLCKQEFSQRSFALTALILSLRGNNYYALMLRRDHFFSIDPNNNKIKEEICFVNYLLTINAKEYQFWVYKKQLFMKMKNDEKEYDILFQMETDYLDGLLEDDSKNYHVWDYKLWLAIHFKKQKEQLSWSQLKIFKADQVKKMVEEQLQSEKFSVFTVDWSNCYSLWSYRFNLAKHIKAKSSQQDKRVYQTDEVSRVKEWLSKQKNTMNQCGWNYLAGTVTSFLTISQTFALQIYQFSYETYTKNPKNRFAGNSSLQLFQFLKDSHKLSQERQKELILALKQNDPVRQLYYDYLLSHSD